MRLDVELLRYLTAQDLKVLRALEKKMRDHEMVPFNDLRGVLKGEGELKQVLKVLGKVSLTHQETGNYRLTYHGQDAIALKELHDVQHIVGAMAGQMGCGKESDLFGCQTFNGDDAILKLHRLGRTSFKKGVKSGRDYIKNYKFNINWLTMSMLSAKSEAHYMTLLSSGECKGKFRIPRLYGSNRHAIVMGAVQGKTLMNLRHGDIERPDLVLQECFEIICKLAKKGFVHGDFNEFNLMLINEDVLHGCPEAVLHTKRDTRRFKNELREDELEDLEFINHHEKVVMIDFPQMVSIEHPNARMYFERDVEGIMAYFKQYAIEQMESIELPTFEECVMPYIEESSDSEEIVRGPGVPAPPQWD